PASGWRWTRPALRLRALAWRKNCSNWRSSPGGRDTAKAWWEWSSRGACSSQERRRCMPDTMNPSDWLPRVLFFPIPRGGDMMVRRDKVTWADLVAAREGHCKGQARAQSRCASKAYMEHTAKLARIEAIIAVFAPLMQAGPTLGFEDACARMSRQALKVVKEL